MNDPAKRRALTEMVTRSDKLAAYRPPDIVLLGNLVQLERLAEGLNDKGLYTVVLDVDGVSASGEAKARAIARIRNVQSVIAVFQALPTDQDVLAELMAAKQLGKAVAFVPMASVPVRAILQIAGYDVGA
jgi:molybdenum cofactor biosynthesis enzyme MoaA